MALPREYGPSLVVLAASGLVLLAGPALVRTLGLFPPGSEVMLSDYRKAVVVARGSDLDHPLVRVTHDPVGLPIPRVDQPAIQLEPGGGLDVAEFLLVGITDETGPRPPEDSLNVTTGFSEYFQ